MADEDEGFKITDRRGQRREWAQTPSTPPVAPEPSRPTAPSGAARPEHSSAPARGGQADLSGLFVMFASSALIGLGAAPDPMSGQQRVDFEQARESIETLLLLRAKTEGNRTEDESRLLEEILYDLQMRYVQATRRPGRPG